MRAARWPNSSPRSGIITGGGGGADTGGGSSCAIIAGDTAADIAGTADKRWMDLTQGDQGDADRTVSEYPGK